MNTLTKQDNVPTPRTDAEEELLGGLWYVLADFARELERELAEAGQYAEKLRGLLRRVREGEGAVYRDLRVDIDTALANIPATEGADRQNNDAAPRASEGEKL